MALKDLPTDAQPREKLLARGPQALADAELLALLLRTGIKGKSVLQMAGELLAPPPLGFGGVAGLLHATAADLARIKGLGPAKRAELVAVLELARRVLAEQLRERPSFNAPQQVKDYLQLQLAGRPHEVFAVMFITRTISHGKIKSADISTSKDVQCLSPFRMFDSQATSKSLAIA